MDEATGGSSSGVAAVATKGGVLPRSMKGKQRLRPVDLSIPEIEPVETPDIIFFPSGNLRIRAQSEDEALLDKGLHELALALLDIEWKMLKCLLEVSMWEGNQGDVIVITDALTQLEQIRQDGELFISDHLQSSDSLRIWKTGADLLEKHIVVSRRDDGGWDGAIVFPFFQQKAEDLWSLMPRKIAAGLDFKIENMLRIKTNLLNSFLNMYAEARHQEANVRDWSDMLSAAARISEGTNQGNREQTTPDQTNRPIGSPDNWIAPVMWLTFVLGVVGATALFASGTRLSSHEPGSVKDADFWFLCQTCVTQFLGLLTSMVPLFRGTRLPKTTGIFVCLFACIGMVFDILAPFLYTRIATEWAVFLSIIVAGIQQLMTLQFLFLARNDGKETRKKTAEEKKKIRKIQ